jgi:hypothetical protein
MPAAVCELTNPESKRQQTHVLANAVAGIGQFCMYINLCIFELKARKKDSAPDDSKHLPSPDYT